MTFGFNDNGNFRVAKNAEVEGERVPLDPAVTERRDRFSSMAYDSRRHRIVLASGDRDRLLFAFDLARASWSKLGSLPLQAKAMAYSFKDDAYYLLVLMPTSIDNQQVLDAAPYGMNWMGIMKISPDGRELARTLISKPVMRNDGSSRRQLVLTGGKAVLLTPPVGDGTGRIVSRIDVFDLQTGEVQYSGILRPHDGKTPPKPLSPP